MCEKTNRLRILQVAAGKFLHATSDRTMREYLGVYGIDLTVKTIRKEFDYLSSLDVDGQGAPVFITKLEDHNVWSARITAAGIDLVTGAVTVSGVHHADPIREDLARQKDIRRGILSHLNERRGKFIDDFDVRAEFERDGFISVILAEIQFHLWYLEQRGYVERHSLEIRNERNERARITAAGIDLVEGNTIDPGVTTNGSG